jgi:hypothetical protein
MLGERSQMSLQVVPLKDLPTLILVPAFIQKKNNTNMDSTGFESPGSQIFIEARCMNYLSV